jgi:hypothetical protein
MSSRSEPQIIAAGVRPRAHDGNTRIEELIKLCRLMN